MCTCTINIDIASLNLSYVYFFLSRGRPSEFLITAHQQARLVHVLPARRGAFCMRLRRGRGRGCNCGSTGHGRHGPTTSTCDLHSRSAASGCAGLRAAATSTAQSQYSAAAVPPQAHNTGAVAALRAPLVAWGHHPSPKPGVLGQRKGDVPEQAPGKGCLQLSRRCAVAAMPCVGARHWPGGVDIDLHSHGTLT